ncbi:nucleophile aminohydrolase [Catenaria anguillulae PL171]|uniref:Proteasome subunit alpha type n=1 Tax=Catenaria anguillulae PL171 TaxID=765915 RepID=A0A1Y2H5F4_9FUNG|nr:nucleophile aminohydrolase [Catenaria anguillulae PL171]
MTSIGTGYDLSSSTYSPDGRIFQVEYANKAVENSGTAIGLRCKDGVVLAIEKLVPSKLLVPQSNKRTQSVDYHIGVAPAGLQADGRHLVGRAREEAASWRQTYKCPIQAKQLADRVAMYVQAYTLYSSVRPFGAGVILASMDDKLGPQMYMIDPAGQYFGYRGVAIGKGKQVAKTEIEKLKLDDLTVREAVKEAARILHVVHDEAKDKDFEIELSWVCAESKFRHAFVPEDLVAEAQQYAEQALNPDEMED